MAAPFAWCDNISNCLAQKLLQSSADEFSSTSAVHDSLDPRALPALPSLSFSPFPQASPSRQTFRTPHAFAS
eukprot:5972688-Pleurochrysis_carterae.AAC.1